MSSSPEFLSITPQRVRCYKCGTYSEKPEGWHYRLGLTGHKAVCPACSSRAERYPATLASCSRMAGAKLKSLTCATPRVGSKSRGLLPTAFCLASPAFMPS